MSEQTNQTPDRNPNDHGRHKCKRRGLRRAVLAGGLLLAGAGIGATTTAFSQGYGPHGGDRGAWSEDGEGYGWRGPMGGPMGGGWHHHRGPMGPMFGPGSVERMVDRLARATDASTDQKQKMNAIAQKAAADVMALREKHLAGRKQMRDVLAAPTIDRAKLETLRVEQMKLADEASKRIVTAVADMADVLTPTQRADFAQRMDRFGGGR